MQFRVPLEAKKVLLATLQDEVEEVVEYVRMYLDTHCYVFFLIILSNHCYQTIII